MTTNQWAALLAVKAKLNTLLTIDKQDGAYWKYMELLAINNVIASVVTEMQNALCLKPEEVKK
jgi:hypothetical protein